MGGIDTMTGLDGSLHIQRLNYFSSRAFSSSCGHSHNIYVFRDDAVHLSQPGELTMKAVTPIVHSEK